MKETFQIINTVASILLIIYAFKVYRERRSLKKSSDELTNSIDELNKQIEIMKANKTDRSKKEN